MLEHEARRYVEFNRVPVDTIVRYIEKDSVDVRGPKYGSRLLDDMIVHAENSGEVYFTGHFVWYICEVDNIACPEGIDLSVVIEGFIMEGEPSKDALYGLLDMFSSADKLDVNRNPAKPTIRAWWD